VQKTRPKRGLKRVHTWIETCTHVLLTLSHRRGGKRHLWYVDGDAVSGGC
jgi:hypothetical protein